MKTKKNKDISAVASQVGKTDKGGNEMTDKRSEAKFTPGPWTVVDVTGEKTLVYRRIDGNGKHIGFAGAYKLKNQNEAEANARLIAAAPDQNKALQRIEEIVTRLVSAGIEDSALLGDLVSIAEIAEKALAKAESIQKPNGGK